jgi:hypothetical protein
MGSCINTLVSSTKSLVGPVLVRLLRAWLRGAAAVLASGAAGALATALAVTLGVTLAEGSACGWLFLRPRGAWLGSGGLACSTSA